MNHTTEPIEELRKDNPGSVDLKVDQDDPEIQQHIADFVSGNSGDTPARQKESATGSEKPRVIIPPDDGHLHDSPQDLMMTEALVDTTVLPATDSEKDLFLKAMLNEVPVEFEVVLYDGKWKALLRSQSHHEKKRIFDVVQLDRKEGLFDEMDYAMAVTRVQQYAVAIQLSRINGVTCSEISLKEGNKLAEDAATLRAFVKEKLENISSPRWTTYINALRIFETKCAEMSTKAANADFWKPRATV